MDLSPSTEETKRVDVHACSGEEHSSDQILSASASPSARLKATTPKITPATADLAEGLARWRLWGLMGWQDIKQRYRRSTLGPFWLTLSMAIMVTALGVLYGKLFQIPIDDYLPFLTLGFIAWGLISGLINEGCLALTAAESLIKEMKLPYSIHVYRVIWRNLIIFSHNLVVYFGVIAIFQIWPGVTGLLALPALALITLNAVWIGLLFGMLCARFRDIPQIITSLLQVIFFLTPIIWKPELLRGRVGFAEFNPFFHFVEIMRAPLLGEAPTLTSWAVALAITAAGWVAAVVCFSRYRRYIPYWV